MFTTTCLGLPANCVRRELEARHQDRPGSCRQASTQEGLWLFSRPQVIQALVSLVNSPEPEHPLRADLAGLTYKMLRVEQG